MDNTFYMDFTIADKFGAPAVKDTYDRAFKEWHTDYKMLTELVIALNHKIWEHYNHNNTLAQLYNDLWGQADDYAQTHLTGDALRYFYDTTD